MGPQNCSKPRLVAGFKYGLKWFHIVYYIVYHHTIKYGYITMGMAHFWVSNFEISDGHGDVKIVQCGWPFASPTYLVSANVLWLQTCPPLECLGLHSDAALMCWWCMRWCNSMCIYIYIYVYEYGVCVYVCIYIHMFLCTYVYMYKRVCIYMTQPIILMAKWTLWLPTSWDFTTQLDLRGLPAGI